MMTKAGPVVRARGTAGIPRRSSTPEWEEPRMRHILSVCVVAWFAGAAAAQETLRTAAPTRLPALGPPVTDTRAAAPAAFPGSDETSADDIRCCACPLCCAMDCLG